MQYIHVHPCSSVEKPSLTTLASTLKSSGGEIDGNRLAPDRIRVSYGTALVLGLKQGRQEVPPTTAYLLWDEGCQGACSFCPRANGRCADDHLSRITWPMVAWPDVLTGLGKTPRPFRRICLQTGWHPDAGIALPPMISGLLGLAVPVSLTLHPAQHGLVEGFLAAGLDHVGIGLDAGSPRTYAAAKRRDWEVDWPAVRELARRFGPRIEVHMIFGLGDTEQEFLATLDDLLEAGADVSLFAFTPLPEPPTIAGVNDKKALQNKNVFPDGDHQAADRLRGPALPSHAPHLAAYRRIQAFRFLRRSGVLTYARTTFDPFTGQLISFGFPRSTWEKALADGEAFRTAGCAGCNRPFYNERPQGPMYNFPRPLTAAEVAQAMALLAVQEPG
jgi:lipoyl synthase